MNMSHRLKTCILFVCIFFSICGTVSASEAKITNLQLNNTRDHLLVYLDIDGAFKDKMEKVILAGVPASFTYHIKLHQIRNLWFDKEISEVKAIHTIRYDNLKKEFYIYRSWENAAPITTKSFDDAKSLMSQLNSLELIELNKLNKDHQYEVLAKAELSKVTLPLYLHYVLFFVSMWDFETDWHSIRFNY